MAEPGSQPALDVQRLTAPYGALVAIAGFLGKYVDVVAEACDELVVLNFGEVIASGPTAAVLRDPAVRSAYLGRTHARDEVATTIASDA